MQVHTCLHCISYPRAHESVPLPPDEFLPSWCYTSSYQATCGEEKYFIVTPPMHVQSISKWAPANIDPYSQAYTVSSSTHTHTHTHTHAHTHTYTHTSCMTTVYLWVCILVWLQWLYCVHVSFRLFVFSLWSTPFPYSTKQNPLVYRSLPVSSIVCPSKLGCIWQVWIFLQMQLSRTNLGVRFLFEIASVASYSPNPTVLFLLENPLSNSQVVAKVSLLSVYPVNKCV